MTEQSQQNPNRSPIRPVLPSSGATERLGVLRAGLGEIVAGMQDTLKRLGIEDSEGFIESNRQTGGQ